ncbi:angiopoietin-1 receptor-like [Patiria miniata]|uniref:Uncharacterized protein n=1 Tax=Patiria miniata TaxID=46514 RepID=A0A913ZNS1_PATMI|nr:angiopoietin-1 receptor-like [Patiria miniata]
MELRQYSKPWLVFPVVWWNGEGGGWSVGQNEKQRGGRAVSSSVRDVTEIDHYGVLGVFLLACPFVTYPCQPSPCQNGGTCFQGSTSGGFFCMCSTGFTGTQCQNTSDIDDCILNPCLNGGTCKDGLDRFTCTCATGYTGGDCDTNIADCIPNACLNGGTCVDGLDSFACTCAAGYTGDDCGTTASVNGDANTILVVVIGVLSTLLVVIVASVIVYAVWRRVKRRRRNMDEAVQPPADVMELAGVDVWMRPVGVDSPVYEVMGHPNWAAKWEILWSNLVVGEQVLGRGNFGEVKKGTLKIGGKKTPSAIKMLKGQASDRDQKDFMDELRTMSIIGYHQNVVSLLGACQHQDVLYVALEFLPNGDLHSYLTRFVYSNTADILTSKQLLKFALDVARGMKHLSNLGVVHRDLAARNIHLGEDLIAKVSGFGLSRGEDIYVQTSTRRVPTRWLAIESLMHKTYTTQSDVWSFGIVLWEIATLGGRPYPDIPNARTLTSKLREGYRMPKPGNCHQDIYGLMCLCWDEDPNKRPTFTHLVSSLSQMDANKLSHTYMEVDRAHYETVIRREIDEN